MATVRYWFGTWVSASEDDALEPGDVHNWIAWPYNYGETVTVTANPLVSGSGEQILAVENVQIESSSDGGRRIFYTVRNVGSTSVDGYGVGYSFVSS
jgi:hypothetical protein